MKKRVFLKVEVDLPEFDEGDETALQEIGTIEMTENGKHVLIGEVSLARFLVLLELIRVPLISDLIQQ